MTVINKLNQTLEMMNMVKSNLKTFSMDTDDQNAKQMYEQLSQNIDSDIKTFQSRVNFVMSEEPQYSQGQQAKQAQQMQSMQSMQGMQNQQNQKKQQQKMQSQQNQNKLQ